MPRVNEEKYVEIDAEKLKKYIKDLLHLTQEEFAAEIGRSRKYISNMKGRTKVPDYVFNMFCRRLGVEPEALFWEEKIRQSEDQHVKVLVSAMGNLSEKLNEVINCEIQTRKVVEDLHKLIAKIQHTQETSSEEIDKVLRKVNANTIQMERLKEFVMAMSETEYDRAKQFLQNALKDGRIEGVTLFAQADAACIKRSELMKVRKDLNVQIKTTGYGKNQTAWWIKE